MVLFAVFLVLSLGFEQGRAETRCVDSCTLPDGQRGFCFENKCLSHVDDEEKQNLTFSVTVKYPETELQVSFLSVPKSNSFSAFR